MSIILPEAVAELRACGMIEHAGFRLTRYGTAVLANLSALAPWSAPPARENRRRRLRSSPSRCAGAAGSLEGSR